MARCTGWLLSLAATSALLCSSAVAGDDAPLAAKLRVTAPPAGRARLVPGTAKPYVEARRLLARGRPSEALEALAPAHGDLFADREALIRGDALLALGEPEAAHRAFTTALDAAVVRSVARAAMRGLAEALRALGRAAEAEPYLDALLAKASGSEKLRLRLAKARLRAEAGDAQGALELAIAVARDAPASRTAEAARRLAERMAERGAKRPPVSAEETLARARALIGARRVDEAKAVLDALDPKAPEVRLARARWLERSGDGPGAERALEALTSTAVPSAVAVEALAHLAKRRFRADDNEAALALFDRVVARAPRGARARKAEYLAGWIPYDAGRYAEATKRMLAYARHHPMANNRDEALWYAGWASYLGAAYPQAEAAFFQLLAEHPRSSLVPHVHYWLGRIAQKQNEPESAKASFRAVLARAPLGYYALWAAERLRALGEAVTPPSPPEALTGPASVEAALSALGPSRPITVDRSILLHRAGRRAEAVEELESSSRALRKAGGAEARTRVADLLHQLGAHHLAFRTAMGLTRSGAELLDGEPLAWRAWRHAYPRAFEDEVTRAETAHEVEPEMVWAVMRTESHYRPWVKSRVGARGLMQLMPATARQIGRTAEGGRRHAAHLERPESNIWLGTWYLGQLIQRYGGQVVAAVGAYNGGPTAMDAWLEAFDGMPLDEFVERIPYRETRRYVRRVVETWAIYQQLYGGDPPTLPRTIRKVVDAGSKAAF